MSISDHHPRPQRHAVARPRLLVVACVTQRWGVVVVRLHEQGAHDGADGALDTLQTGSVIELQATGQRSFGL